MKTPSTCPECGALWENQKTCQDDFHQMLYWESENPSLGEVHHLMVLCYHLQHPSLYSMEGLGAAKGLLREFLEGGVRPQDVRLRDRAKVTSEKRKWKIKATATSQGAYKHPVQWRITVVDVVAGGAENYSEQVKEWAQSILETLIATYND